MIIGDGLIIGLLGTGKSGFFPSFFFGGREQTSDAVLSLLLSCENRALGTQVLGVYQLLTIDYMLYIHLCDIIYIVNKKYILTVILKYIGGI